MTIWILALLLLASGAGMGMRQGAIRAAISFLGIIISGLLACPLAGVFRSVLPHLGVHSPAAVWLFSPVLVFVVLLAIFKSLGQWAHHKAEVFYKYRTDDASLIRWMWLNKRLGLGVGLLNGLAYLALVTTVIYGLSYWTVQIASSDEERWPVRLLNRMGRDLESTGLIKLARALNPLPPFYFQAADLAGLLYQNPQLSDRLAAYPPFLSLAQSSDFQQLGQDADFQNAWKSRAPIGQLLDNPKAQPLWRDPAKATALWNLVRTNYEDLTNYLQTGRSEKFPADTIVGRWDFNVFASLIALGQTQPNFSTSDMLAMQALWTPAYSNTVFVAGLDGQAFLDNLPHFNTQPNQPPTVETASWRGQWSGGDPQYVLSLTSSAANGNKSGTATITADRLTMKFGSETLVFDREK
ncbi:MAG TPA: CvpA family protein [Verrucomicrobiae bacterium]|nr:CvpA family protein [Verrucomicrobiae bacterium]